MQTFNALLYTCKTVMQTFNALLFTTQNLHANVQEPIVYDANRLDLTSELNCTQRKNAMPTFNA